MSGSESAHAGGHPWLHPFQQQVDRLVELGYAALLGLTESEFRNELEPLKQRLPPDLTLAMEGNAARIPFVLVVNPALAPARATLPLVRREGHAPIERLYPIKLERFQPLAELALPPGSAYLLLDIDRGDGTLNVAPKHALEFIRAAARSPLTVEEGIAVLTQHPMFLEENRCFSLLGSRCGDKRVPAFWLSGARPKLGWCWEGNPHTWIGSASCAARVGLT